MNPRPLASSDIVVKPEAQLKRNRYRIACSLKNLSAVNWTIFVDKDEWEQNQPIQRAVIALTMARKLKSHLERVSEYVMLEPSNETNIMAPGQAGMTPPATA